MNRRFTDGKFRLLSCEKQNKELAKCVKDAYLLLLEKKSPLELWKIYCAQRRLAGFEAVDIAWDSSAALKTLSDLYHAHLQKAGIFLREHAFLPAVQQHDKDSAAPPLGYSIYLDNLRSSHNVGSILRTTEAFRLGAVHFSAKTPWITNAQVQKASMGSHSWVACSQTELAALPRPHIVLETAPDAPSLFNYAFPPAATLIFGNEEYGVSEEALSSADALIHIPMRGRKNSLNVANAFAIVAAEIVKQRLNH